MTNKPITGTYFETNLSRFGLADLSMATILDFEILIFQPFEELLGSKTEWKLITPKPIIGTYF